jgi:hypothetical protein
MKFSASLVGGAVLFGAVSCKEKPKDAQSVSEEKSVVEKVVETVKEAVEPIAGSSLSDEERAAKLGFAKYLPKDTEMVMSAYNSEKAAEQLKALRLYGLLELEFGGGGAVPEEDEEIIEEEMLEVEQDADADADAEFPEEGMGEGPSPWMLLGQEVTIALGDTAGEQTGRLLTLNRRMGYFQARALGKAAQSYAKTGNMEEFSQQLSEEMGEGLFKNLVGDAESGIGLFEKAVMPPLYISFRAKEGELEQAAQLVNGSMAMFGMAGEMAAPVELETGGSKFLGYKLLGSEISKTLEESRESMEENLSPESVDALLKALAQKNLVVVTGTIGDHVVMMIGGSEESLKLVSDVKDSLVATDKIKFADPFADKQLVSLVYGSKEVWDEIMEEVGGLGSYAIGLRDGIAGGGGLGDTRDLEAMLDIVAEREKALMALGVSSDLGLVAYVEDGLKIESFGGYDKGAVDWDAETKLAHLGDSGDNVLFLNIPSNAAYDEKAGDYIEAIVETAYAATVKLADLEIDAPQLAEMRQFTKLFDGQFREDAAGLYVALDGMSEGLGNEVAVVMDLKGSVPALPGVPQKVVDEAKAPRITMIAPVTDRSKIRDAWKEMDVRATSLLAKVSEMTGEKIPMQKPISSEKDGMTTWFFSFPFFQDDFLPSVTVSDEWFALSTSKTQSLDLLGKSATGGEAGSGIEFKLNFNGLAEYADETLKVVDGNAAEIFTDEAQLQDFNMEKADIKKLIEASRDFDSMTWTVKKENGRMHGVVHFRTK